MNDASKQAFFSALRTLAGALGGYFVGKGVMDEATAAALGVLVMIVAPLIWGMVEKFQNERKTEARVEVALNAGIRMADANEGPTPAVAPASVKAVLATIAEVLPPTHQSPAKE